MTVEKMVAFIMGRAELSNAMIKNKKLALIKSVRDISHAKENSFFNVIGSFGKGL